MPHSRPLPIVDQLLAWSVARPLRPPARYLVATAAILTIAVVRGLLVTTLIPWLLFVPALLLVGLMFGRGPGLYATVLAAIAAGASIGSAANPAWLTLQQWIASILFVVVSTGIALLAAELRASFVRAKMLTDERTRALDQLAEREAFLTSVLASSTDCIKVLDLEGRVTFMSDAGQAAMGVNDFSAVKDCPFPAFWSGEGNGEASAALAAARQGKATIFVARADTLAGKPKWWNVAVSPIAGADGRPERILTVSRDITAIRASEEQRGQLARIVENSRDSSAWPAWTAACSS